jgi:PAS domain S-box-containing protein
MRDGPVDSSVLLHAGPADSGVRTALEAVVTGTTSIRSVDSFEAAVEAATADDVACLVCEADVAGGSPTELLTAVRSGSPELPSLFVTSEESAAAAAIGAGATDVFVRREGAETTVLLGRRLRNVIDGSKRAQYEETVDLLGRLYDVTTGTDESHEEKIDQLLRLGCETLGLSNGFLTRLDVEDEAAETGEQTIIEACADHELLQPGASCPLSQAYCRKTIRTDGLLAFENAVEAGWADDPAYEVFELGCYIGGKVVVDGDLYGTLCFASTDPREAPFTELERATVRVMSKWLSYELERREARAELELKNRAMDAAPVGILISDPEEPDNRAVYVNDQFTALTGYDESAVLGRNCRFLQGEDTRQEPVDEMRAAIDENRSTSVELRNYRADGSMFWNRVTVAPIRDADGEVTNYVGFQEDITERKEQELELKLRDRAISEAPIGITIHDASEPEWPITYANSGLTDVTGYDRDEMLDAGLSMFAGEETDTEAFDRVDAAVERGEPVSTVLLLYRRDGTPIWARVSVAPVTDDEGAVTHFVGFIQDVTDTKERAEEIARRLDEFGDLLAEELRTPVERATSHLESGDVTAAQRSLDRAETLIDDLTTVHSTNVVSRDVFDVSGAER